MQYGEDSEARLFWQKLKPKIPSFFEGIQVEPSLLHGDLWSGNSGETKDGPGLHTYHTSTRCSLS